MRRERPHRFCAPLTAAPLPALGSSSRHARYVLLESRSLALAGEQSKLLDVLAELLARGMASQLRLRADGWGADLVHLARRIKQAFPFLDSALHLLEHPVVGRCADDVYNPALSARALVDEANRTPACDRMALDVTEKSERDDVVGVDDDPA